MFLFKRKPEVYEHLYALVPDFNLSSQEFYAAIEEDLKTRKVPSLEISRVEYAEGGLLSDKRLYLHFARERLTFDICAAPFGTAYFFSCRFAEIPATVQLWHLIAIFCVGYVGAVGALLVMAKIFGALTIFVLPMVGIGFLACLAVLIFVMRDPVGAGIKNLDAILLKIPVVNAIYEAWFRKETYYREDTRRMYFDTVKAVVKEHVENVTAAKGITLVTYHESSPVLGVLYKPVAVELPIRQEAAA
jgi:hypothetical protein